MIESLPPTSLLAAFLAGLLSTLSPCALPLLPSYLACVTGLSLDQAAESTERRRLRAALVANALLFIAAFSVVFIAFGASGTLVGRLLADHQTLIRKVGAALIIFFGLYLLGILQPRSLMAARRLHPARRQAGYVGSVLIGATFAAWWTPCVGPVLGTMLLYAGTAETLADGVTLLTFYSIGLGLPLFATTLWLERAMNGFTRFRAYAGAASIVSGALLLLFGLLMYRDEYPLLTTLLERDGIGWDFE